jgi:hypothetical protein
LCRLHFFGEVGALLWVFMVHKSTVLMLLFLNVMKYGLLFFGLFCAL